MTKFVLDTSALDSAADSINNISKNAHIVMRSVNKYDVNNNDNFNFAQAKDAIVTNVSSAYVKFRLTNEYLKQVVTTHTELQESVKPKAISRPTTYSGYQRSYNYGYCSSPSFSAQLLTSPKGMSFFPGTISFTVLKGLLEDGTFSDEVLYELNKTNENVLVLSLSKDDESYEDKVDLAEEIAEIYDIKVLINEKEEEDFESSFSIVKNGVILAATEELTDIEEIKKMFAKVDMEVPEEDLEDEDIEELMDDIEKEEAKKEKAEKNGEKDEDADSDEDKDTKTKDKEEDTEKQDDSSKEKDNSDEEDSNTTE